MLLTRRLSVLVISTFTLLIVGFNLAPVYAQDSNNNDIIGGLCAGANLQVTNNPSSADCNNGGESATAKVNRLVKQVINFLSALVGIVAVIMIIFGGLRYITSGGNDANVTSAKNTILYAVIGLIIVALAQIIVRFTLSKLTNP